MSEIANALGAVAPYYNLAMVCVAVYLFIKLFRTPIKAKNVYVLPWKYLFAAVIIYILEEIFTVLRSAGIITIVEHVNGFFELVIISLFIYALLLNKEYIAAKR